jgi:glycosyltransferase involved in cell wall biosynthesis
LHFCTRDDDAGARQAIVIHDILRYNRPHLHLLLVAASEAQRQRLAAFARQLAFDDLRVHVLHVGEVGGWPSAGRVVLITSPHRSPAVAATALAQGAAVAGWQMPELAEMLGGDLAVGLAAEGKTAELAARVRRLIDDPLLLAAQGEAMRQRASHYTRQRMQTHLQGLYNDLQRMKVAAEDLSGSSRPTLSAHR